MKTLLSKFFTRRRRRLIILGVFGGAGLFLVAEMLDSYPLWQGLLINLSAAALEVLFILSILDYWSEGDKRADESGARKDAKSKLESVVSNAKLQIAILFGYNPSAPPKFDPKRIEESFEEFANDIESYLKASPTRPDGLVESWIDNNIESMKFDQSRLTDVISFYDFCLDPETRSLVLRLRDRISNCAEIKENFAVLLDNQGLMNELITQASSEALAAIRGLESSKFFKEWHASTEAH